MTVGRREARLRAEHAQRYLGVPIDQWRPIGELVDRVTASRVLCGCRSGEFLACRPLDDHHFDFRGGRGRPDVPDRPPSRATDLR
jgi:hypothetical protein